MDNHLAKINEQARESLELAILQEQIKAESIYKRVEHLLGLFVGAPVRISCSNETVWKGTIINLTKDKQTFDILGYPYKALYVKDVRSEYKEELVYTGPCIVTNGQKEYMPTLKHFTPRQYEYVVLDMNELVERMKSTMEAQLNFKNVDVNRLKSAVKRWLEDNYDKLSVE